MNLTFETLRAVNSTRSLRWHKTGLNEWSLADWVVATGGEVGEALNVVKKLNRARDGQPGNTRRPDQLLADLADELADAVIYLDTVVNSEGDGPLGVLWSAESFADLRSLTLADYPDHAILSGSEWSVGLLEAAGKLATTSLVDSSDIGTAADELLQVIDVNAYAWGIDLGLAVARKFNATSERYGFPERLAA